MPDTQNTRLKRACNMMKATTKKKGKSSPKRLSKVRTKVATWLLQFAANKVGFEKVASVNDGKLLKLAQAIDQGKNIPKAIQHICGLNEKAARKMAHIIVSNGVYHQDGNLGKQAEKPIHLPRLGACARCGQDHDNIKFAALTNPVQDSDITHWAPCPTNGEPIMMAYADEKKALVMDHNREKRALGPGTLIGTAGGMATSPGHRAEGAGRGFVQGAGWDIGGGLGAAGGGMLGLGLGAGTGTIASLLANLPPEKAALLTGLLSGGGAGLGAGAGYVGGGMFGRNAGKDILGKPSWQGGEQQTADQPTEVDKAAMNAPGSMSASIPTARSTSMAVPAAQAGAAMNKIASVLA